jgi:hypothetical protein
MPFKESKGKKPCHEGSPYILIGAASVIYICLIDGFQHIQALCDLA